MFTGKNQGIFMNVQIVKHYKYNAHSNPSLKNGQVKQSLNFNGKALTNDTIFIDKILKNKYSQKLFNLASMNPHTFNLTVMALMGITLRPATIMVIPGAEKEDKQYAAGKSIISAIITTTTQAALCIPLAKTIEKYAIEAHKNPAISNFPRVC